MRRTVVLDVVGLTPGLVGDRTPHLASLESGPVPIGPVMPAVTCSVQATYLRGKLPRDHGIVGNGWYFRDLNEVWFWRQSNRLVEGPKIWHQGRRRDPAFTCANSFWWYNMATDADWSLTPRPLYLADGRKLPDCYSDPPELRREFQDRFGPFPLFEFWGPATSIASSEWIARAAEEVERRFQPTLQLVYLPHLDYVLQREGPHGNIDGDLREIDTLCGRLIAFFRERGCRVVVLSEYGIGPVTGAVHPNRILREAGLLAVKKDHGREYLDPGRSKAFAVADHQVAHVYVQNGCTTSEVAQRFGSVPGVEQVLEADGIRGAGLDHPRSGEIVLVAERDHWFSYYFWNDDARAPDYARTVDIHNKPGYDPCELFLDPRLRFPKGKIGWTLLKKTLGFRTTMDVIPLEPGLVKGSHGRPAERPEEGPLLMTTEPKLVPDAPVAATDVCGVLLEHVFVD